jgi:hypothetical protein
MISAVALIVRDKIIKKIIECKFFCLIVDECKDISRKNQLAIIIRYLNEDYISNEIFLSLIPIDDKTREGLFKSITRCLMDFGIDLENMRGLTVDGGSNFAGYINGLKGQFNKRYPNIINTHCQAHILSLCIADIMKNRNKFTYLFEMINDFAVFILNSSERLKVFLNNQTAKESNKNYRNYYVSIKLLCPTRWSGRYQALESINENIEAIIKTLEYLYDNGDEYSSIEIVKIKNFLNYYTSLEFCIYFPISYYLMKKFNITSKLLQERGISLSTGIKVLQKNLIDLRYFIENNNFDELWNHLLSLVNKTGIENLIEYENDKYKRKIRANDSNIKHTYKDTYVYPIYKSAFMDIVNSIEERFNKENQCLLNSIALLEGKIESFDIKCILDLITIFNNDSNNYDTSKIKEEITLLNNDYLYLLIDNESIEGILRIFKLHKLDVLAFPFFTKILKIILTLSPTTAEAERIFSLMKIIKTRLRSTIMDTKLSDLILISKSKELVKKIPFDEFINIFSSLKERKIQLK